ncbi:hypothetical protein NIES2100_38100 [Calothrix sp. NIES-2100]|uniref:hypothetical protein n=1 Tax=Calothrix sp. NIES-2100 TaxID=1954172 RepID=UPI000B5F54F2|nr:hypothetical protein NIES2100_38100 [Calothrix sp. NIES-2100]
MGIAGAEISNTAVTGSAASTLGRRNIIFEAPNDEYRQELIKQSQLLTRLGLIKQQPNWDNAIDTTLAKAIALMKGLCIRLGTTGSANARSATLFNKG